MRWLKKLKYYPPIHQIFQQLKDEKDAVFLDSSLKGELGKFSIIACQPYLKLVKDEIFTVNGVPCKIPFTEYLRDYLAKHQEENPTHLPLISGAIGYFSYDFGREKEGVASRHAKSLSMPDCILTFYDIFIIEDHEAHNLYLIYNGKLEEFENPKNLSNPDSLKSLVHDFVQLLQQSKKVSRQYQNTVSSKPQLNPNFTKEEYMQAVQNMRNYIQDGDIYVVNMTQQLQIKSEVTPYEMFCNLRKNNPSPFGAYLNYSDFQIVSASIERFLQMKDGHITTRPIKGTRKRGDTAAQDAQLKEELAHSQKDQSELLMIVDLERNDLNRVCIPGSVQVTELFHVETYATVFQLIANVQGQLRPELNAIDLLNATFPGGSITGAPKLRAMELIDQEEHCGRNIYTGSIGYLSLNGDCDFNIVIRSAVHQNGIYHLGVGGGITWESDPLFEYEETWQKAKALLNALGFTL